MRRLAISSAAVLAAQHMVVQMRVVCHSVQPVSGDGHGPGETSRLLVFAAGRLASRRDETNKDDAGAAAADDATSSDAWCCWLWIISAATSRREVSST